MVISATSQAHWKFPIKSIFFNYEFALHNFSDHIAHFLPITIIQNKFIKWLLFYLSTALNNLLLHSNTEDISLPHLHTELISN